jgi:hypothetical protein
MTTDLVQTDEEIQGWFAGRIPDGFFSEAPVITADREEILVVGRIPEPDYQKGASAAAKSAARVARIARWREETRDKRIGVALEAQHLFRRKVSWGAECGDQRRLFTTLSVPVMTRLRMEGRAVLDVLVDAGVARSRSEALAWCVKLVGENQEEWLKDLKKAFEAVEKVRAMGPDVEQA